MHECLLPLALVEVEIISTVQKKNKKKKGHSRIKRSYNKKRKTQSIFIHPIYPPSETVNAFQARFSE